MHDPKTVAFELRRPWPQNLGRFKDGKRHLYWPALITIWHVDPETDGTDDSCGWSRPKLTKEQRSQLEWLAGCETRSPWFQREAAKEPSSPADAEALMRGALLAVAGQLRLKLSVEEATELAISFVHEPLNNIRGHLCLLPGYHTNDQVDTEWWRQKNTEELFFILGRVLARRRRRWWQHPRWHIWHWHIQIHPLQAFKRWAFSRCCRCGKRFPWGYSPLSRSWNSVGPRWFKSEPDVMHFDCDRPESSGAVAAVEASHAP
jgi:hypothetical protein